MAEELSVFASPVGMISFAVNSDGALSHLDFVGPGPGAEGPTGGSITRHLNEDPSPEAREVGEQVAAYFRGELREFDLPLATGGTPFQQLVWQELRRIPFGWTRSYSEIAVRIGRPTAVRAVGAANARNPIAIVIPCHRVVGVDGSLTGYAGGLKIKEALLELEEDVLQPSLPF